MLKATDKEESAASLMEWEVEINPGQKVEITYNYSSFSWL
jgi:hypothetical protein